jgi:hypothetical protein
MEDRISTIEKNITDLQHKLSITTTQINEQLTSIYGYIDHVEKYGMNSNIPRNKVILKKIIK